MERVYDNGETILGSVYNVKDYVCRNAEETWEIEEILYELEHLDADTIVAINYDGGMGYSIAYWDPRKHLVERSENNG